MKTLFTITFVAALIFAFGFIVAPGFIFDPYGITLSPFATSLIRVYSSALLGFAVLLWYGRSSSSVDLHKAILRSMFLYWFLSSVMYLVAQLTGVFNAMGWLIIVLHGGFSIAYGVFAFKK